MASTHSRPGEATPAAIAIDGVRPGAVAEPASADELASLLTEAAAASKAVAPVGGGTKLALGNCPERIDLAVSTRALNRVLHYEPTDLTLSVEAGMRFGYLQSLLAERGQTLPVEIADAESATVGGMIATALAGPRRFGSGTLRDLLIGIAVAYPSGIVGKAGGMVVKNVSGFDLMRLHLGALGTLGVIVSANFKVLPAARDEATVLVEPRSLAEAMRAAAQARWDRSRPIAIDAVRTDEGWQTAIRIEGRPVTVARSAADLRALTGAATTLGAAESRAWWSGRVGEASLLGTEQTVLVRCGSTPARTEAMVNRVEAALRRHEIAPEHLSTSPGLGECVVRFTASAGPDLASLQSDLPAAAETVTVLKAPPALKAGIDIWGKPPETIPVMRALKQEFDPGRVLNPGRFVDRI